MDEIQKKLDEYQKALDKKLADAQERLSRKLSEAGVASTSPKERERPGRPKTGPTSAPSTDPSQRRRLSALPRPECSELSSGDLDLLPTNEELLQMAAYVFYCPHVQGNAQYQALAMMTSFTFDREDPEVNAFATSIPFREGDDEILLPVITFQGGIAAAFRIASLAAASDQLGRVQDVYRGRLLSVVRELGQTIVTERGLLSSYRSEAIMRAAGLGGWATDESLRSRAASYFAGMSVGTIAHEMGHVALGHVMGEAGSLEIRRNQEREADSFASSVVNSSPFRDYLVASHVIQELIFVWADHSGHQGIATTHPLSRERLLDFIRANASQCEALGINQETIRLFLPPD